MACTLQLAKLFTDCNYPCNVTSPPFKEIGLRIKCHYEILHSLYKSLRSPDLLFGLLHDVAVGNDIVSSGGVVSSVGRVNLLFLR